MSISTKHILYIFLKNPNVSLHESYFTRSLGIASNDLTSRIKTLNNEGFTFEITANQSYKLIQQPFILHEDLLKAYMHMEAIELYLTFLKSTDSTQTEAHRRLANNCAVPIYVLSQVMTAGRGRRGRTWMSQDNGNMYLSVAYKPHLSTHHMQLFSLWIGVMICKLLNETYSIPILLKWPNDLVFEDKKCGGILTEALINSECMHELVLGIGLNINARLDQFPTELQAKATSLACIAGKQWNMNALVASILKVIEQGYTIFLKKNYLETFYVLWQRYDSLKGNPVIVEASERTYKGIADGIDSDGKLIILTANGKRMSFHSGNVSLTSNYSHT